jgi:AAA15 family ATPase/GTPase
MIKNIKINNYKCFKNFEIKDFKRINILVGDNNSGKTSLLEALALLDPKTFKRKDDLIFKLCQVSNIDVLFSGNLSKVKNNYFKECFEEYSISFNKRNIEKSIFIEADFNSSKKDSKSDFVVKFENKIINEIIDFPKSERDSYSIEILQNLLDFSKSILATYKFSNKKNLLKLGASSNRTYNDNIEGFDDFDIIYKQINERIDVVKNWTQIINQNGVKIEEKFIKLLQNFDGDIEAIRVNQHELDFYKKNPEDKKIPFVVPLSSMGEGFKRFFDIIVTLELMNNNKPQILCIDEIDNGLYYDKQDLFWEQIIKLCEEYNIQLFATTHSYDALLSLLNCGTNLYPKKGQFDKIFNISKLIKFENEIKCFRYNQGLLSARIENQMETR